MLLLLAALFLLTPRSAAQPGPGPRFGAIGGVVTDASTGAPLPGANVVLRGTRIGASSDELGAFLLTGVPAGPGALEASLIGYEETSFEVEVAAGETLRVAVRLAVAHEEMEEVVVTGTRTVRSIADVPVRVEVIPEEEVEEKLLMTPSSVAMLLNESTGMRVQTTSAASSAANLRIQGLSGRYTQLLTDGIPNFGGLAAGFSITQMPPLNLRQVEVIKGATSALYGPDAIGGVVNFITKRPPEGEGTAFSGLVNATTASGADGAVYAATRTSGSFGATLFASGNTQSLHDVDGDRFGDIAAYDRISASGKVFLGGDGGTAGAIAAGFLAEDRTGGAMESALPSGAGPSYSEKVRTRRADLSGELDLPFGGGRTFFLKGAAANLRRDARYGGSSFDATQRFLHLDAQIGTPFGGGHELLAGTVFSLEELEDRTPEAARTPAAGGGAIPPRNYTHRSPALFLQAEWAIAPRWSAVTGARADFHNVHGTIVTPRASVRHSPGGGITVRAGAGGGFKAPTIFTEELEEAGFRNVRSPGPLSPERAVSGSFDINWKTLPGGGFSLDVNAAAYLTRLADAVTVDADSLASGGAIDLRNATGPSLARGGELSLKIGLGDLKLFLGYTYLYATLEDRGLTEEAAYNPRHSAGMVLFYEAHESGFKAGLETYWTGRQRLERNPYRSVSPDYFLTGLIAEKALGHLRLFINFENIFDTRQTRWDRVFTGDLTVDGYRPVPVYAPLEGRVINGGVRLVY